MASKKNQEKTFVVFGTKSEPLAKMIAKKLAERFNCITYIEGALNRIMVDNTGRNNENRAYILGYANCLFDEYKHLFGVK